MTIQDVKIMMITRHKNRASVKNLGANGGNGERRREFNNEFGDE